MEKSTVRPGTLSLLALADGQVPGGGGNDKLRLTVWNQAGVVYDNVGSPDVAINRFDNWDEQYQWGYDFGSVNFYWWLDYSADANANPYSAAMAVQGYFDANLGQDNQLALTRGFGPGMDLSSYTRLKLEVKVDPSSTVSAFDGSSGLLALVLRNGGSFDWVSQVEGPISSADGWVHVDVPLVLPDDDVRGITLKLWAGPLITLRDQSSSGWTTWP